MNDHYYLNYASTHQRVGMGLMSFCLVAWHQVTTPLVDHMRTDAPPLPLDIAFRYACYGRYERHCRDSLLSLIVDDWIGVQ